MRSFQEAGYSLGRFDAYIYIGFLKHNFLTRTKTDIYSLRYGLGSMVFLLIFLIPGIGTTWLNYILPISSFVCLPLLFMVKEEYRRLELDKVKM